jgi:type IV pilus assembly protein PilV
MRVLGRQRGETLIEVMVAVIVFSIGVLGIALMQIKGAQFSKQSGARTVAVLQTRSLADAMRANPAGVYGVSAATGIPAQITALNGNLSNSYYLYNGTTAPNPATDCVGANVACVQARTDLQNWINQLKLGTASPTTSGSTTVTSGKVVVNTNTGSLSIISSWAQTIPNQSGTSTNDSYQFDYQP